MFPSLNEQMDIIKQSAIDLLPENELVQKIEKSIKTNNPMNIKLGADPSRPDLHIGHAVVLNKMRQFQDLGHHATLIIGDFTAMIGDPTGKSKTRPQLTLEDTKVNGQSYLEQATLVLREDRMTVRYNSEWLNNMNFADVIQLAAKYTVAQLLERDDFTKRYKGGIPISVHELLYPLAQAMDSAEIDSDVELGGTDQKFNLIVGRDIQRAYGKEPQVILTMPILEGTDGKEKMSKSLDNYVALNDTPTDIFGKVMSIPDHLITKYYRYGCFASDTDIDAMESRMKAGENPRNEKVKVAIDIVDKYHKNGSGQAAFEEFQRVFKKGEVPDEVETYEVDNTEEARSILNIMANSGLLPTKSEARRMVKQGAVSIDGEKIQDMNLKI
ncbi:tyrosine--tRNA ligase, partial [Candidatus Kapabacteria bacterium]|nr:tyrosine--tRNA ligase [Candidatus Kapabacteria bacterium]